MSNIYDEDDDLIDDEAVETLVIDIMEKKNEIKRKTPMLAEIWLREAMFWWNTKP